VICGLSIVIVCLFAAFLIGVGLAMTLKPLKMLDALRHMGGTVSIHFTELSLRFLAGLGLYGFAEQTSYLQGFQIVGLFLMITSLIIMCVPHKLHNAYAVWWANKIPPIAVRFFGLFPIIIGVWLLQTVRTA